MYIHNHDIQGLEVNSKTGCLHYHSHLDIVAIKFKCCQKYYSCYSCHLAIAEHPAERWTQDDLSQPAIFCGHCGLEMTIYQYLFGKNECQRCNSKFNTKCILHWNLYFEETCFSSVKSI